MPHLALALALTGCAASAASSLACDYATTRRSALHGWSTRRENNPAIAESAGPAGVDVWFGVSSVALAGAAAQLTPAWRRALYAAVTVLELRVVVRGAQGRDGSLCGLSL